MLGYANENTLDTLAATGCTCCNSNTQQLDTSFLSCSHFLNSNLSIQANNNKKKIKDFFGSKIYSAIN